MNQIQLPNAADITRVSLNGIQGLTAGQVCYRKPDGLILSTGNLYFTSHDSATASLWRASQSADPGREILLYSEPGARFGDIVFAQVNGIWWGVFLCDHR